MNLGKNTVRDLGWSVVGASIAIAIALWFVADGHSPFLLASLGGSMLFLFALTESEAAQPRALFGGHLGGALIGILAFRFLGDALWVSVLAVVLTMVFMVLTRTIHPPAGAPALRPLGRRAAGTRGLGRGGHGRPAAPQPSPDAHP